MFNCYSLRVREIQETIGEEAWQRLQYKIRKCMQKEIALLVDILAQLKNISQVSLMQIKLTRYTYIYIF